MEVLPVDGLKKEEEEEQEMGKKSERAENKKILKTQEERKNFIVRKRKNIDVWETRKNDYPKENQQGQVFIANHFPFS